MVNSFKINDESEFVYFWAVNEEGIGGIYCYDVNESTIQRASFETNKENNEGANQDNNLTIPTVDPLTKGVKPSTFATVVAVLVAVILALLVVTFVALGKAKEEKNKHHSSRRSVKEEKITESPSEKLFQKQLEEAKKRNDEADSISLFNDEDKFPVEEAKEEPLTEEAPIEEVLGEEAEPHETESVEEKTEEADFDEKALEEMLFPNGIPEKAEEELKIFDDEEKSEE